MSSGRGRRSGQEEPNPQLHRRACSWNSNQHLFVAFGSRIKLGSSMALQSATTNNGIMLTAVNCKVTCERASLGQQIIKRALVGTSKSNANVQRTLTMSPKGGRRRGPDSWPDGAKRTYKSLPSKAGIQPSLARGTSEQKRRKQCFAQSIVPQVVPSWIPDSKREQILLHCNTIDAKNSLSELRQDVGQVCEA